MELLNINTESALKVEERTRCEIWTRAMGYCRPVSNFNIGKKAEFKERVCFTEEKATQENLSFSQVA